MPSPTAPGSAARACRPVHLGPRPPPARTMRPTETGRRRQGPGGVGVVARDGHADEPLELAPRAASPGTTPRAWMAAAAVTVSRSSRMASRSGRQQQRPIGVVADGGTGRAPDAPGPGGWRTGWSARAARHRAARPTSSAGRVSRPRREGAAAGRAGPRRGEADPGGGRASRPWRGPVAGRRQAAGRSPSCRRVDDRGARRAAGRGTWRGRPRAASACAAWRAAAVRCPRWPAGSRSRPRPGSAVGGAGSAWARPPA